MYLTKVPLCNLSLQKKADYVLALKSNHPTLYSQLKDWFDVAVANNFEGIKGSCFKKLAD